MLCTTPPNHIFPGGYTSEDLSDISGVIVNDTQEVPYCFTFAQLQ